MGKIKFLQVSLADVRELECCNELVLLYFLKLLSKRWKLDDHGYFHADSGLFQQELGIDRFKLNTLRKRLVDAKRIDYIPGNNQNRKPRYKVL